MKIKIFSMIMSMFSLTACASCITTDQEPDFQLWGHHPLWCMMHKLSLTTWPSALKEWVVSFQIFIEESDKSIKRNYVFSVIEVRMACAGDNH